MLGADGVTTLVPYMQTMAEAGQSGLDDALLDALEAFPGRWTRPAMAVAATLTGERSMWLWCEALDELDAALLHCMPRASGCFPIGR